MSRAQRQALVEPRAVDVSVRRQCQLLDISRSSVYYRPKPAQDSDLELMRLIDEEYLRRPFYGSRRMRAYLNRLGHPVNRKRVQRLMRQMGLHAVYPRPRTSRPGEGHRIYPYLRPATAAPFCPLSAAALPECWNVICRDSIGRVGHGPFDVRLRQPRAACH